MTHNLTVVFFSRSYIRHQDGEKAETQKKRSSAIHTDSDGQKFEDHYKIVIENETNADYDALIHRLKKEFVSYPTEVKWSLTPGNERTPSTASQGNILEAINITLNLLHLHYIDRDLHRTGNRYVKCYLGPFTLSLNVSHTMIESSLVTISIVILTPGNGVFEISKNLAGITKQRMMVSDNINMLSLFVKLNQIILPLLS